MGFSKNEDIAFAGELAQSLLDLGRQRIGLACLRNDLRVSHTTSREENRDEARNACQHQFPFRLKLESIQAWQKARCKNEVNLLA